MLLLGLASCAPAGPGSGRADRGSPARATPRLTPQRSGTDAVLQAVSAPSADVVWVGGHAGTILRTTDGGDDWEAVTGPPESDSLQFRDVWASSERVAYLLSAGPGPRSRIYATRDGGAHWALQFVNPDSAAFFDCLDFWDGEHGLAFSDAVDGEFVVIATRDAGRHWSPLPRQALPPAVAGEGGFAASGTCLVTGAGSRVWIGTGGTASPRVLRSGDGGRSWSSAQAPIPGGDFAGITSLAFRDSLSGLAAGGDLGDSGPQPDRVALTSDGGQSWRRGGSPAFPGAVYGAAFAASEGSPGVVVAVGPGGASVSSDGGARWSALDSLAYWAVGFASNGPGWMVGPEGRITRLDLPGD